MKQRIFAFLLAFCLIVCLLPTAAFAARWEETEFQVTVTIDDGGEVSADGESWGSTAVVTVRRNQSLMDALHYRLADGYEITGAAAETEERLRFISVQSANESTFLLDEDGHVWSAGHNYFGQLGRTENAGEYYKPNPTFERVTDGIGDTKITAISAKEDHVFLLDENGHVWSAGNNSTGELGRTENVGTVNANPCFARVTDGIGDTRITAVSVGGTFTMLLDENGHIWTAGYNYFGQLGYPENAKTENANPVFRQVTDGVGDTKFVAISAGTSHALALDENGSVWSAGYNYQGELGYPENDTENGNHTFRRVTDGIGGVKVKSIFAGSTSSFAIDENGGLWSAGENEYGQLGRPDNLGTLNSNPTFTKVTDGIGNTKIIAGASSRYCTVLLDEANAVWTAGGNICGLLSRSDVADHAKITTFTKVTDGIGQTRITMVSTSSGNNVLLDVDGNVWINGENYCGQCGYSDRIETLDGNALLQKLELTQPVTQQLTAEELTSYIPYADGALHITLADTGKPVISGVTDGTVYCTAQTVTVTDAGGIASVTLNGVPVTLNENGTLTLSPVDGKQTLVATDRAGNVASVSVTVNNGHSYSCYAGENGIHYRLCAVCGDRRDCEYTEAVVAPTCTSAGYTVHTCGACGNSYIDTIVEGGHKWASTVVAPTHTEMGYTLYTCSVCDESYKSDYTAPIDHTFDEGKVTKPATCTDEGEMTYTCSCGKTHTAPIARVEHSWDSGKVASAATLTETGKLIQTCTLCGATKESLIPMLSSCDGGEGCPSSAYTDVPTVKHWAHVGIDFVLKSGLFYGTSDTTFSPDSEMTRAMLVTVLYRLEGQPKVTAKNPFGDVPSNTWYTSAVIWAAENKIVNGIGGGKFDPDGEITREQMAAILYRYSDFKGMTPSESKFTATYPDESKVSTYALDAMRWANAEKLINGTEIGGTVYLDPQGSATRAQVAAILMRFVQNVLSK